MGADRHSGMGFGEHHPKNKAVLLAGVTHLFPGRWWKSSGVSGEVGREGNGMGLWGQNLGSQAVLLTGRSLTVLTSVACA